MSVHKIDPGAAGRDVPEGLDEAGVRLWASIVDRYELAEHQRVLLLEACRLTDQLAVLDEAIRTEGAVISTAAGRPKTNPASVERRHVNGALLRTLATLRIPDDDGDRPQRRGAARGAYRGAGSAARNARTSR